MSESASHRFWHVPSPTTIYRHELTTLWEPRVYSVVKTWQYVFRALLCRCPGLGSHPATQVVTGLITHSLLPSLRLIYSRPHSPMHASLDGRAGTSRFCSQRSIFHADVKSANLWMDSGTAYSVEVAIVMRVTCRTRAKRECSLGKGVQSLLRYRSPRIPGKGPYASRGSTAGEPTSGGELPALDV